MKKYIKMIDQYYNEDNTILILDDEFNQNLTNVKFPTSLQSITFGYCFNQGLTNVKCPLKKQVFLEAPSRKGVRCPDSLKKIKFADKYCNLTINSLPIGIKEIEFDIPVLNNRL